MSTFDDMLHLHIHHDADPETLRLLRQALRQGENMSQALDDIKAALAKEDTLIGQAVALLKGLPAAVAAAVAAAQAGDAAEAASIQADIVAQTTALADGLAAATPPAPAPAAP